MSTFLVESPNDYFRGSIGAHLGFPVSMTTRSVTIGVTTYTSAVSSVASPQAICPFTARVGLVSALKRKLVFQTRYEAVTASFVIAPRAHLHVVGMLRFSCLT